MINPRTRGGPSEWVESIRQLSSLNLKFPQEYIKEVIAKVVEQEAKNAIIVVRQGLQEASEDAHNRRL